MTTIDLEQHWQNQLRIKKSELGYVSLTLSVFINRRTSHSARLVLLEKIKTLKAEIEGLELIIKPIKDMNYVVSCG